MPGAATFKKAKSMIPIVMAQDNDPLAGALSLALRVRVETLSDYPALPPK